MSKALSILSGGADSTICTAIALLDHSEVHSITFNYGQRHKIEIESAATISQILGVSSHAVINCIDILQSNSPLVSDHCVDQFDSVDSLPDGVANTFVPTRNLLFLTVSANIAFSLGCDSIYIGVCQTDSSGYPDCRLSFIRSAQETIKLSLGIEINIQTPLMHLTKAESILKAQEILGCHFETIMSHTHTCYEGVKGGCGKCAACLLRERGFREAGIPDPIKSI